MEKVQEIVSTNCIQVAKTVVKENGDVFVDLPSEEVRSKLTPLLNDQAFAANEVVSLKSKLPSITILDVKRFSTKEVFVDKIKKQNPEIKELMDKGSEFTVVFCKNPREGDENYQVVARVSDDVRKAIKENRNRIYVELESYRVVDRFYIKRCNKCQKFGHYENDCQYETCCGYCRQDHLSAECEMKDAHHDHHKCINCQEDGKDPNGHSAFWHKCPTYLELQKKLKKSIPYYQKN